MISMIQRMMVRIGVVVETNQAKEEARMIEDATIALIEIHGIGTMTANVTAKHIPSRRQSTGSHPTFASALYPKRLQKDVNSKKRG